MKHEYEKESRTWSSAQLLELLHLADDGDEEKKSAGSVPELACDLPALRAILSAASLPTGESAGSLLTDLERGDAPLERCVDIKEKAKIVVGRAQSDSERLAALFLYHAAIAVGIARHGEDRSAQGAYERWPLYSDLAAVIPDSELAEVFGVAADYLMEGSGAD